MSQDRLSYSVDEAAAVVGIGHSKAWELVKKGDWPIFRVGSRTLIARTALEGWVARQQAQPATPKPTPIRRKA